MHQNLSSSNYDNQNVIDKQAEIDNQFDLYLIPKDLLFRISQ